MKRRRLFLRYIPPGQRKHTRIPISRRQLELVAALRDAPASRMELLKRERPRLALNAPATVAGLRAKGIDVSAEWQRAEDIDGSYSRFVRYALQGRVLGIEGA